MTRPGFLNGHVGFGKLPQFPQKLKFPQQMPKFPQQMPKFPQQMPKFPQQQPQFPKFPQLPMQPQVPFKLPVKPKPPQPQPPQQGPSWWPSWLPYWWWPGASISTVVDGYYPYGPYYDPYTGLSLDEIARRQDAYGYGPYGYDYRRGRGDQLQMALAMNKAEQSAMMLKGLFFLGVAGLIFFFMYRMTSVRV